MCRRVRAGTCTSFVEVTLYCGCVRVCVGGTVSVDKYREDPCHPFTSLVLLRCLCSFSVSLRAPLGYYSFLGLSFGLYPFGSRSGPTGLRGGRPSRVVETPLPQEGESSVGVPTRLSPSTRSGVGGRDRGDTGVWTPGVQGTRPILHHRPPRPRSLSVDSWTGGSSLYDGRVESEVSPEGGVV